MEPWTDGWIEAIFGNDPKRAELIRQMRDEYEQRIEALEDKIQEQIAEFGDDPEGCLAIISEHIQLRQHFRAHPNAPTDGL